MMLNPKISISTIAAATAVSMMVACSSQSSPSPGSGGDNASATQAEPIRAELAVENGNLVILAQNDTAYDATLSLDVNVDSATVHSENELEPIRVLAGQAQRHVVAKDRLEGFDVAGSSWLRAELRYQATLDNGQTRQLFTALAARDGAVLSKAEAIATGLQLVDRVLTPEPSIEKAFGTPFKVCFTNPFQFSTDGNVPNDGLSPNLFADSGSWPFYGQVVYAYYPATVISPTVKELDANGCVSLTRKEQSGNETWKFRVLAYGGTTTSGLNATAYAIDSSGSTPFIDKTVVVTPNNDPSTVTVEFSGTEAKNLYTATFLAVNSLRRVTSILGLSPPNGRILRISPSTDTMDPAASYYCRAAVGRCPTAITLRTGNGDASRDRGTIAHETGHYIHHWYTATPFNYDYTRANSGLPLDGCDFKRQAAIHNQLSIEWQSAAHIEGLADFFRAVTYNKPEHNCSFEEEGVTLDCEAAGKSIFGNGGSTLCGEWNSSAYINRTGNELDWTKMYWDFLTDYTGTNFALYMQAEQNVVASLTATNSHFDIIRTELSRLNSTQGANLRAAANGNTLEGDDR